MRPTGPPEAARPTASESERPTEGGERKRAPLSLPPDPLLDRKRRGQRGVL